jgi:CHASE2 domain-containing sensor protein
VRGFLLGLILIVGLSLSILSLRPGGVRRQLRFAVRRFRIMLILCGVFLIGSGIVRLAFPQGWVADFGPPALAIVLAGIFVVIGRDPTLTRSDQN